ncbi:MAG TPA: hypothetical protein VI306_17525 [Pyrinomonadaceae bacterium]
MSANEKAWVDLSGKSTSLSIDDRLHDGIAILWRAHICAHDTGANVWDLSLPTSRLFAAGMTNADLRWMVAKGFAEHREETTNYGDVHRSFKRGNDYFLNDRSSLILTLRGASLAATLFGEAGDSPRATLPAFTSTRESGSFLSPRPPVVFRKAPAVKPRWDATRRELTLDGLLVKRFRVPALNQETILSVFEEEEWAEHIHDPLPLTMNIDAPTRLHDAINRLNRCQINSVIRFHGDGKGTGVFWGVS